MVGGTRTRRGRAGGHGLFFAHLALEKALKAQVCRHTQELAPRLHNLVRLAEMGPVAPTAQQRDLLAEMNEFGVEMRYPDALAPPPAKAEAVEIMSRAEEVWQWLMSP